MVEKVEAWKDSAGVLHETQEKAADASCRAQLAKCLNNTGMVNEIMKNARCVYDALAYLFANKEVEDAHKG